MADMKNKKKKTAKAAIIGIGLAIAGFLLPIFIIVAWVDSWFDFFSDDPKAKEIIKQARLEGVKTISVDTLAEMHLTRDGLEELNTYADPAVWQPVYKVTIPYYLYVNQKSEQHRNPPLEAKRVIVSDKEGYEKYVCYETVEITGPNLSKYALTWQDVYTIGAAIHIGERGETEMNWAQLREIATFLEPSVEYSADGSIEEVLEILETGDKTRMNEDLLENDPFRPLPEITTDEVITVTRIVTPTPEPTQSVTPTEAPTTPTPTPTTKPKRPDKDGHFGGKIFDVLKDIVSERDATPTPSPTQSPMPTQPPIATPTPTETPQDVPDGPFVPTPTKAPEAIVIEEQETIIATIEQHYTLFLVPSSVKTWYASISFFYPELSEDATSETAFAQARPYPQERNDVFPAMAEHYGVTTDMLDLIPDIIDTENAGMLTASIEHIPKSTDIQSFSLNLTLSQANTLSEMSWPLPGDMRLHDLFESRVPFMANGRMTGDFHYGWDIGGVAGAPIVSVLAGKVVSVGFNDDSGNYASIQYGDGSVVVSYCHCSKVLVKKGDEVLQNQVIALVGSTGRSTAPHLHFTLFIDNKRTDPAPWLIPAMMKAPDPERINDKGTAYREGRGAEYSKKK